MMNNLMASEREIPIGVKIIAALTAIQGIISVIVGFFVLVSAFVVRRSIIIHGHRSVASFVGLFGTFLGGGILLEGALALVFAWGLWTLQRWAFWATVILAALMLIFSIFGLARHTYSVVGLIIDMIIPAVILIYFLIDPAVRQAFNVSYGTDTHVRT